MPDNASGVGTVVVHQVLPGLTIIGQAGEEEESVLKQRTADARSEVVNDQETARLTGEVARPGIGVQRLAAVVLEQLAMKLIRAALV